MLSNAYFLAKFRFDTAENEPAKNLQNFAKFANFADPKPLTLLLLEVAELARKWALSVSEVQPLLPLSLLSTFEHFGLSIFVTSCL